VHHVNRPAARKLDEPLALEDLAYSGCAEFARQWLLINRRVPFIPGQPHRLRMLAGGSRGQGGLWEVDIDEGELDEDFGGRHWDHQGRTCSEAKQERKESAQQQRAEATRKDEQQEEDRFLKSLDELRGSRDGKPVSLTSICNNAEPQMNDTKGKKVLARL